MHQFQIAILESALISRIDPEKNVYPSPIVEYTYLLVIIFLLDMFLLRNWCIFLLFIELSRWSKTSQEISSREIRRLGKQSSKT